MQFWLRSHFSAGSRARLRASVCSALETELLLGGFEFHRRALCGICSTTTRPAAAPSRALRNAVQFSAQARRREGSIREGMALRPGKAKFSGAHAFLQPQTPRPLVSITDVGTGDWRLIPQRTATVQGLDRFRQLLGGVQSTSGVSNS